MSIAIRNNETTAARRLSSRSGGLGYWAARDFYAKNKKAVDPKFVVATAPTSVSHDEGKKKEKPATVARQCFSVEVGHISHCVSIGMFLQQGEAQAFFEKVVEHSPNTVQLVSITNGVKTVLDTHCGRGFKLEKVARFNINTKVLSH